MLHTTTLVFPWTFHGKKFIPVCFKCPKTYVSFHDTLNTSFSGTASMHVVYSAYIPYVIHCYATICNSCLYVLKTVVWHSERLILYWKSFYVNRGIYICVTLGWASRSDRISSIQRNLDEIWRVGPTLHIEPRYQVPS